VTASQVTVGLPEALDEIAQDFAALSARDRLTLLLDFSDGLPGLPERYEGHAEMLERVDECQTPLFLVVEVENAKDPAAWQEATMRLFFEAPPQAPTTRGSRESCTRGWMGSPSVRCLRCPTMRHTAWAG
jgi:cysteine desulfuration protein SufE